MSRRSLLALVVLALAVALAGPASARGKKAPPRRGLNMPPGWSWPPTPAMRDAGKACLEHLDELGIGWKPAPAVAKVTTPIYLDEMSLGGVELQSMFQKGPFVMDCLLAAALAEQGPLLRSAGVSALRFTEIHDYRNINGGRRKILSRHALGLAIDVFAIVTDDGLEHGVEREYPSTLLVTVEGWLRQSDAFRMLTPGNDLRHHKDHFHLEVRAPAERSRSVAQLQGGGAAPSSRSALAP